MLHGRLERVERDRLPFDLWQWATPTRPVAGKDELMRMARTGEGMCGCGGGWSAMDPDFQALGLHLQASHESELPEEMRESAEISGGWLLYPVFGPLSGMRAVQAFFGLSGGNANFLFLPHSYPENNGRPPARLVAQRVKMLMQFGDAYAMPPGDRSGPADFIVEVTGDFGLRIDGRIVGAAAAHALLVPATPGQLRGLFVGLNDPRAPRDPEVSGDTYTRRAPPSRILEDEAGRMLNFGALADRLRTIVAARARRRQREAAPAG